MRLNRDNIAIFQSNNLGYPSNSPYNPHIKYPEYPFNEISQEKNFVYDSFRQSLFLLGLDKENFGSENWNPFREFIKPGNTVVINPNFVIDHHETGGDIFSVITHPSVLRAIADYIFKAIDGNGKIIIADAPQMDCNFSNLLKKTRLDLIQELYNQHNFKLEIYDLRNFWVNVENGLFLSKNRHDLPGDPEGSIKINLGKKSLFFNEKNNDKYYGADYNREETIRHHSGEIQEYLISKSILNADVVILAPKLKTHKKVGVTLNMKGLVGINTNKNYLVHYKVGSPSEGGDEFPSTLYTSKESILIKLQQKASDLLLSKKNFITDVIYQKLSHTSKYTGFLGLKMGNKERICCGNWSGNDSTWRMTADLLNILLYADKNGELNQNNPRKIFSIVDGFIGGEGNGPLAPDAKHCGLLIMGMNPCAVDLACTRLMGFDIHKIKMLDYILKNPDLFKTNIDSIKVFSNLNVSELFNENNLDPYFDLSPPKHWESIKKTISN